MGVTGSIVVIAIGAILAFAVDKTVQGVDLIMVGWILMIAGAVGLVLSLIAWETWGGFHGRRRSTVVEHDEYV